MEITNNEQVHVLMERFMDLREAQKAFFEMLAIKNCYKETHIYGLMKAREIMVDSTLQELIPERFYLDSSMNYSKE